MYSNAFSSGFQPSSSRSSYNQIVGIVKAILDHREADYKDGLDIGGYLKVDGYLTSDKVTAKDIYCNNINALGDSVFNDVKIKGNLELGENLDIKGWGKFGKNVTAKGFYVSSDFRKKKNIQYLKAKNYEKILGALEPCVFEYKKSKTSKFGFIAQDLNYLFQQSPKKHDVVKVDDSGYLEVDMIQLIPLLTVKMNRMDADIKEGKKKINALLISIHIFMFANLFVLVFYILW
jgi:hypothetical protein